MPYTGKTQCTKCNRKVFDLPRHMRQYHNWSQNKSKSALNLLNLRKVHKNSKTKTILKKKFACPVQGCYSKVQKLGQHLTKIHKIPRSSKTYLEYIINTEARHHDEQSNSSSEAEETLPKPTRGATIAKKELDNLNQSGFSRK